MSTSLAFDLEELAADVFEIDASGLAVESLTGGHGMTEVAGVLRQLLQQQLLLLHRAVETSQVTEVAAPEVSFCCPQAGAAGTA